MASDSATSTVSPSSLLSSFQPTAIREFSVLEDSTLTPTPNDLIDALNLITTSTPDHSSSSSDFRTTPSHPSTSASTLRMAAETSLSSTLQALAQTSPLTSLSNNETTFNASDPFDVFGNSTSDPNGTTTLGGIDRVASEVPFYLKFRDEPWVIPLVAMAIFNVVAILVFEVYVLYKSCGGRRHLFLGQVLLLGLFLSSLLALVYVPEPHWLFCGITRAGVGILYTVVFGVLLVKCVFLLKFHYGVYFNASFQALFLFFIVGVEIAIVSQWMAYKPPNIESMTEVGGQRVVCNTSPLDRIPYLSYAMLLLFMVIVASIRARSLRENNREAMYIGLSIGAALVFWVAWMAVSLIFHRRYEAPAEAFGLVLTSLLVFALIFVPKAVQLAQQKGSNQHSSSTSHSVVHTPSFLHLQPHAVLPGSTHGTLVKHAQQVNSDFPRNGFSSRLWRYDYPSFHQMETPTIAVSDLNSAKKSNGSSHHHSHIY